MNNLYLKQLQVESYQIANKKSFLHLSPVPLSVELDENVHLMNEHNVHVGNMRCVHVNEISLTDLPDLYVYLFMDMPKKYLRQYMKGLNNTVYVYVFSSNAFYHNYYEKYEEVGMEYRQGELFNASL